MLDDVKRLNSGRPISLFLIINSSPKAPSENSTLSSYFGKANFAAAAAAADR